MASPIFSARDAPHPPQSPDKGAGATPGDRPGSVPFTRWETLVAGTLLVCAIALRLVRPDLAQTSFDEANAASLVDAWKFDGLFPLAGTASTVNIPFPGAWSYFIALAHLPIQDPYSVPGMGIAMGVLTVVVCWWVSRRWLGPWGAIAATAFYGFGFWPTMLGRSGWQPAFMPVLLFLAFDALLTLAVLRRPWALAAVCGWLGVVVQFHYIAGVYVLLLPFAAWPARRSLRPVHVAAAILTGVIPLLAFFILEADPEVRFRDVANLVGLGGGGAQMDLSAVSLLVNITSTGGAAGLGSPEIAGLAAALGRWTSISLLGPLLGLVGLLAAVAIRPGGKRGWLIAAWTLLPVIALSRHSVGVLFHYLWLDFPGVALCVGALGASAAASRWRVVRASTVLALAVYAVVSVATVAVALNYVTRADTHAGYGIPLSYSRAAGLAARAFLPPGGVLMIGDEPRHAQVLHFTAGFDLPARSFDDCGEVPYVANAVYVLASEQTTGSAAMAEAGAPLLARIPRPGGDAYRVYGPVPSGVDLTGLAQRPERSSFTCQESQRVTATP